uniref:C2H2-type domain-containing protein n=1 Tax=Periophthalmus magnuspinnatus TaxID=409849 RepID=A0A3B4A8A2_9GOBI
MSHVNWPTAPAQLIVCEVCGSFFDSRRGLANHARGHLRQLGVSEPGAAPIDLLNRLIAERDGEFPSFKTHSSFSELSDFGNSSTLETLTKPLWAPLATDAPITLVLFILRANILLLSLLICLFSFIHFALSDTNEELHVCHLCGCWCETRKGLSSHARSHLRQLGIPDGDGNPIETLYQLMEEEDLKPVNCEAPSALQPSPLAKGTKRPADVSSPTMSTPNKQPKKGKFYCVLCGETFENHKGLAIHSRYHLRHFGVDDLLGKESSIEAIQELIESGVLKPLPKTNSPVPTSPVQALSPISSKSPPMAKGAPKAKKGFRFAVEPFFRKPKPENTERSISDVQMVGRNSPLPAPKLFIAVFLLYCACELCGFEFDNRKALASHARAHLRQLGIEWKPDGSSSPIELLSDIIRKDPAKVAEVTQRYRMGDLHLSTPHNQRTVKMHKRQNCRPPQGWKGLRDNCQIQDSSSQPTARPGSIPAMLPKPPLTPLVKVVGKVYSLKCRFCDEVFHGPLSVQEKWITHLQKHIRTLGYKGKASPPSAPVKATTLVRAVAV